MAIDFDIHRATETGLEDMLRLNDELFRYEFDQGFSETYNLEWTYSSQGRKVFQSYYTSEDHAAWIATNDQGNAVGYIAGFFKDLLYRNPTKVGELEMVYIDNDYRCSGIGRSLVEEFKKWSAENGCGILRVGAQAPNRHAREFYEKWGFAEAEIMYELTIQSST